MKLVAAIAAILWLSACQDQNAPARAPHASATRVAPVASAADTTDLVVIDRPTVIGFFPPASDSTDAADDGYTEGLSHVRFALEDALACLGRDSAYVVLVVDTAIRIQQSTRPDTLRFSSPDSLSYGAYLIGPGRRPRLVHVEGPSMLIPAVAAAIPEYFRRGPCPER